MLRFILALVTIGIVVFCLVYFLWTPDLEKPAASAAATVRPTSSAPPAGTVKAKPKPGEDEDDEDDNNNENTAEESDEDAIQEQRRELRMNR